MDIFQVDTQLSTFTYFQSWLFRIADKIEFSRNIEGPQVRIALDIRQEHKYVYFVIRFYKFLRKQSPERVNSSISSEIDRTKELPPLPLLPSIFQR